MSIQMVNVQFLPSEMSRQVHLANKIFPIEIENNCGIDKLREVIGIEGENYIIYNITRREFVENDKDVNEINGDDILRTIEEIEPFL